MQRAACALGFALGIECGGDGEGIGIKLDDGVKRGAAFIDGGDAIEIGLRECACGECARGHALLKVSDCGFFQFDALRRGCSSRRQGG